jgi:hypothetical protein
MSQNDWQLRRGSPSFDFIKLRVADSAARHTEQNFSFAKDWFRHICKGKGSFIVFERGDLS